MSEKLDKAVWITNELLSKLEGDFNRDMIEQPLDEKIRIQVKRLRKGLFSVHWITKDNISDIQFSREVEE